MTALLARRFPGAEIEAFDLSRCDDNLAATLPNGLNSDFGRPRPEREDKIRGRLFEWLAGDVAGAAAFVADPRRYARGGRLACSHIPNDLYEPSRALMRMVAADGPWAKTLLPIAKSQPFDKSIESLSALLSPICATVDIWKSTYLCVMTGDDDAEAHSYPAGSRQARRILERRGRHQVDQLRQPRQPGGQFF